MGNTRFEKFLVGDFETTVYEGQTETEVWASALVEMYTEDVKIFNSLPETLDYLVNLSCNVCVYYHNLKFDGNFWIWYLMHAGFKPDAYYLTEDGKVGDRIQQFDKIQNDIQNRDKIRFFGNSKMHEKTFKYSISALGQWYSITIRYKHHIIELRDSLKLLPFSVKKIGKDFKTKHQKLEMDYEGYRFSGCWISEEERQYIANDVLVVKEALEAMFDSGHNKLTIATCAMSEYKNNKFPYLFDDWPRIFPDLSKIDLPEENGVYIYGAKNVDEYVRKAYKGGWCYLVQGKERRIYQNGTTADVNSLYPSMMHSMSGNRFPIGTPVFTNDPDYIKKYMNTWTRKDEYYYFVRFRCRFYLKQGKLPTVQIKNSSIYDPTAWLVTSDVMNTDYNQYTKFITFGGSAFENDVELTMTKTDYILFRENYDVRVGDSDKDEVEYLDIAVFQTEIGLFDKYIDHWAEIKQNSTGAIRQQAKLMLNSLYGKFATSDDSSFKFAYTREDDSIGFFECEAHDKKTVYIPVGAAITSYARNFTVRAAQKNFHGINKPGFIYADTDSIHCDLPPEEIQGIEVHDTAFCCWKLESCWDQAYFVRQKTYSEHVTHEDLQPVDKPYYNLKAAGMPDTCKHLFLMSMEGKTEEEWRKELGDKWDKMPENERDFILEKKRVIDDFDIGLTIPGKLMPHNIKGGVLLTKTTFEMR